MLFKGGPCLLQWHLELTSLFIISVFLSHIFRFVIFSAMLFRETGHLHICSQLFSCPFNTKDLFVNPFLITPSHFMTPLKVLFIFIAFRKNFEFPFVMNGEHVCHFLYVNKLYQIRDFRNLFYVTYVLVYSKSVFAFERYYERYRRIFIH